MPLKTLTCGLFPAVSHTSPKHSHGYIRLIIHNARVARKYKATEENVRLHDKNFVFEVDRISNAEQPQKCGRLTTCANHMLTWPKMIPEASLKLMYQSDKGFKCHSFQQQWHSEPLNMIHNVILSKMSKGWRLTTPLPCRTLDSDTKVHDFQITALA